MDAQIRPEDSVDNSVSLSRYGTDLTEWLEGLGKGADGQSLDIDKTSRTLQRVS